MSLSPKKLILLGLGVILLIAIPLTVFVAQKQQETRSNADATTSISVIDPLSQTASKSVAVSETPFNLDVVIEPTENNEVGGATVIIKYDPVYLRASGAGFVPTSKISGICLGDCVVSDPTAGTITLSFSTTTPTAGISTKESIGTLSFQAIAPTAAGTPTKVEFAEGTIGSTIGPESNYDIFSAKNPANITITEGSIITTPGITLTPTPIIESGLTPTPTLTPSPTPTGQPTGNQVPVCSGLAVDVPTTGVVPYTVNFTAIGTDSDGTIDKVSLNFGEGAIQDIASGSGIGTNSVNVPASHVYSTAGTFTASAVLTDNSGGASAACSQTITVSSGDSGVQPIVEEPTATPTLAATGPGQTILGIGILGILFSIIGAAVFLIL